MKYSTALLALPTSLLALLGNAKSLAQDSQWPYNLPRTAKYYPEHEAHVKRELEAEKRLSWQTPVGVKKMSGGDEGEKFFLDYWDFGECTERGDRSIPLGNASLPLPLLAAIASHGEANAWNIRLWGRDVFARDFKCPSGTHSCNAIGEKDLCCESGSTCVVGQEGYGCCPNGETCGNTVGPCEDGYHACPNSPNGGCCVSGAVCSGSGCVFQGTRTVTTTLSTVTRTSGASSTTENTSGGTVTVVVPTTRVSVRTTTVTLSPSGTVRTRTSTISGASTCSSGFHSCAASLGGGCCRNGQQCATNSCRDTTTTTVSPNAPVRPTSVSPTGTQSSSSAVSVCPTGYYQCSAHLLGGCCQVGRNCETTSCPPADRTNLASNSAATVIQSGATSVRGSCANGWFACGAAEGYGCCPSDYVCGTVSCTATDRGFSNTLKMEPSGAEVLRWAWGFLGFAVVVGVGMVVL